MKQLSTLLGRYRRHQAHAVRYLFIVTYARSGSTLLQKILAGIPGCHLVGENADALGGLFASWRSTVEAREGQGGTPRTKPGDPWRGAHLIDPVRYNRRLAEIFIEEIVQPPPEAKFIGFKEVRYFDYGERLPAYLDYIRFTFKPALLIFNRRDPEEVARSGWWRSHPDDIASEVRKFDTVIEAYERANPDETISVDYTLWRSDPDLLRPLFERLGEKFDVSQIARILSERLDH
jgi:hypothetical protein